MHEAALRHLGLDGSYSLIDIAPELLADKIAQLIVDGLHGFNVTIPHKDAVFRLARERTDEAERTGAANTILIKAGTLVAHNTDVLGVEHVLKERFLSASPSMSVGVVGAGGAARAALVALDNMHFKRIVLLARDIEKAKQLVESVHFEGRTAVELQSLPDAPVDGVSLWINTTPIGQRSKEIPQWIEYLFPSEGENTTFFDMVYAPSGGETPLVELAQKHGLTAFDGTDMLIHQARMAFHFWTGELPPYAVMRQALEAERSRRASGERAP